MSKVLKVALIGAGHLGSIHARVLDQIEGAELVAVVDQDLERAREIAARHNTLPLSDIADLPVDLDAAVVAVPTVHHAEVVLALFERGVHCLVEKPISSTTAEAKAMVAAARSKDLVLMVGHSERFNPVIQALDRYELEPRFIDCQRVSPFSFRSSDIGVILDMMIHDIDIILHLVKSEVSGIHAVGLPVIGANEDLANARLVFANGSVANATASRVALKTERIIRLFAREAYVTLDFHKKVGRIIRKGPALENGELELTPELVASINNPLEYMQRDLVRIEQIEMEAVEPLRAEDEAFLNAVRQGIDAPVTGEQGLAALETAQKIVASVKESLGDVRDEL